MPAHNCSIWDLVPWPGMELEPPALRAWNLGHWTTREVSCLLYFELLHLEFSLPCPLANSNREIGQWGWSCKKHINKAVSGKKAIIGMYKWYIRGPEEKLYNLTWGD